MNRFSKRTYILTAAIAAGLVLAVILIVQLLGGGPTIETSRDGIAAAVRPGIGRAAGLAFSFWSFIGLAAGALLVGFSIATAITDEQVGTNEKSSNKISLIGSLLGLIIVLAIYILPAQDVQQFTVITVPAEQAESVKNNQFKKKYQDDPGYDLRLRHFRNQ